MSTSRSAPHLPALHQTLHEPHHHGSYADHEPGLWRAVITQALMDASSQSRKAEARRTRNDALHWLLNAGTDFEAVCDHAGLDPDYVRTRARTALQRGCQWRLPIGQGWRTRDRPDGDDDTPILN